jgi:hypothetical protein
VEERGHGDLPAAADLAEEILARHFHVGEEDLIELSLTRDLAERANFHARRLHVHDEVGEALVALRVGITAAHEDAVVGDVRERRPDLLAAHDEGAVTRVDRGADG